MARLIDADELKSKLQGHKDFFVDGWGGFDKMSFATKCRVDEIDNCIAEIVNAPTIDAVPVVRCKDCQHSKLPAVLTQKYGEPGTLTCHNWHGPCNKRNVNKNDFCSYGERRTE